jgi:hypothetical protein
MSRDSQDYICEICGSHSGDDEETYLLGYNRVIWHKLPTFRKNKQPPFDDVSEAVGSSETSINWRYIPELSNIHLQGRENFKFKITFLEQRALQKEQQWFTFATDSFPKTEATERGPMDHVSFCYPLSLLLYSPVVLHGVAYVNQSEWLDNWTEI